jgi:hypothetical protein
MGSRECKEGGITRTELKGMLPNKARPQRVGDEGRPDREAVSVYHSGIHLAVVRTHIFLFSVCFLNIYKYHHHFCIMFGLSVWENLKTVDVVRLSVCVVLDRLFSH